MITYNETYLSKLEQRQQVSALRLIELSPEFLELITASLNRPLCKLILMVEVV